MFKKRRIKQRNRKAAESLATRFQELQEGSDGLVSTARELQCYSNYPEFLPCLIGLNFVLLNRTRLALNIFINESEES